MTKQIKQIWNGFCNWLFPQKLAPVSYYGNCGHKLAVLNGTKDCLYCPDCVINQKHEAYLQKRYSLDWAGGKVVRS